MKNQVSFVKYDESNVDLYVGNVIGNIINYQAIIISILNDDDYEYYTKGKWKEVEKDIFKKFRGMDLTVLDTSYITKK